MRTLPLYSCRTLIVLCLFAACLALLIAPAHAKAPEGNDLLQFTSGSHVVGFRDSSLYLASATHMLKVDFLGGASVAPVADERPSADGRARPFTKVAYPQVWDGVDVVYETSGGSIVKSTYTVLAGKEPAAIRLGYNRPLAIDKDGNLVIAYDSGRMTESRPVAWQVVAGRKKPVLVAYNLHSEKEAGFTVGDYDRNLPLVIDPSLTWNTFLGSSGFESGWSMAVDPNGNVYVTGYSTAAWGSPLRPYTAGWDCFVAKLAADGTLLWNTFLGGSGNYEYGQALAVDPRGNVYVTGGGDGAWGSPVRPYTAGWDCFVAKLTPDGTLLWNTFLGEGLDEGGRGVTVDQGGNVYATGYSEESWGSPIRAYTAGDDAFVAKLAPDGTLLWNTFLGGSGNDSGWGMTVDQGGNVFVAGESGDAWGSPQRAYTAGDDAFVAKLAPDGTLLWNTFLGGEGSDYAFGIALDPSGFLYVAGQSYAAWGAPVRAYEDLDDAFVARLARDGTLTWNTFLGGSGSDFGFAIAVDPGGSLYVAGYSDAAWGWPFRPFTGSRDAFATRLAFDGTLAWNGFLGGSGWDGAYAVAVDSKRGVSVAGLSWETWGAPKRAYSGSSDVFVARILDTANPCTYTVTPSSHSFASGSGSVTVAVEAAGAERCLPPVLAASGGWINAALVSFQDNRGTVEITVAENGVPAKRTGTVTVEDGTFAVTQEGAPCGLAIAPASAAFSAGGGEDSFRVTAAAGCRWTVEVEPTAASWLGASPKAWSGTGSVNYIALENFTGAGRTGRIFVSPAETPAEKKEFTVTQGKY